MPSIEYCPECKETYSSSDPMCPDCATPSDWERVMQDAEFGWPLDPSTGDRSNEEPTGRRHDRDRPTAGSHGGTRFDQGQRVAPVDADAGSIPEAAARSRGIA